MMSKGLVGKVALVTGAGSGIGRAVTVAFAKEGARVVGADRDLVKGEETIRSIRSTGGEALFVPTDVADLSSVAALLDEVKARYGRLDCAANVAGIEGAPISLFDIDEESWRKVIDTNLRGTLFLMKHEALLMRESGGGSIVNTASLLAFRGYAGHYGYCASKHGILGLTRTAAIELGAYSIRVNTVVPGLIETGMSARFLEGESGQAFRSAVVARTPLGRVGQPEDCAGLYVALCRDDMRFVTGVSLAADGGFAITP